MRRLFLLLPLLLLGCSDRQREDAVAAGAEVGKSAARQTVVAVGNAWKVATEYSSKLAPTEAIPTLEKAKVALERSKASLKAGEALNAAQSEIERLQAAIDLQHLRATLDEKVAEAQKLKENAGKTADDVREKLKQADETYRDLSSKLTQAQAIYDATAKKAEKAREAAENLVR